MTRVTLQTVTAANARMMPAVTIVLATLGGALPWGTLATGANTATSSGVMLPLAVIHTWGLWRSANTPAWAAFSAGLLADALTAGPLGYWSLMYLLGLAMARLASAHIHAPYLLAGWCTFVPAALISGMAAWSISSIYQLQPIDWRSLTWPVGLTIAAFPAIAAVLLKLARWTECVPALQRPAGE